MRPGRGFRVVLDGERRQAAVPDAFHGVVVEIDVGDIHRVAAQAFHINGKAVVLGRDFDPPGIEILHRLVGAAMAELELVGPPAQCQPQDLTGTQME